MEDLMTQKEQEQIVTIDGKEYDLNMLSNEAKSQIANIVFVDQQLLQLENEWAVADTARMGYSAALKNELDSN